MREENRKFFENVTIVCFVLWVLILTGFGIYHLIF